MAFAIITRMRKQCVPGTLSSPSSAPGNEANCIDPRVLAKIDPSKHTWKNFPREMLLLGDDIKEEDGQAEKDNIHSSKHMKSDHLKIQFGKASKGFIRLPQSESTGRISLCSPACCSLLLKILYTSVIISQFVVSANISYWQSHISHIGIAVPLTCRVSCNKPTY